MGIAEANDYVGQGLCGGGIAMTAQVEASERGDLPVGNTVLYGATSGELFVAGRGENGSRSAEEARSCGRDKPFSSERLVQ